MTKKSAKDTADLSDSDSEDEKDYAYTPIEPVVSSELKATDNKAKPSIFHFRGINFYREIFNRDARKLTRRIVSFQQDGTVTQTGLHSGASYELAKERIIPAPKDTTPQALNAYLLAREKKLEEQSYVVKKKIRKLKASGNVTPCLQNGNTSRAQYESRYLEFVQRYINSYTKTKEDLKKARTVNLADKRYSETTLKKWTLYKNFGFIKYPFVSTSEEPRWGLEYAFGLINWDKSDTHQPRKGEINPLAPNYKSNGDLKFPYLGVVYITCHTPDALTDSSRAIDLFVKDSIDLKCSAPGGHGASGYIRARERLFIGGISSDDICLSLVVRLPNFSYPYRDFHQEKYGLNEVQYNRFKKSLSSSGEIINGKMRNEQNFNRTQLQIIQHVLEHVKTILTQYASKFAQQHGMTMSYLGIDGAELICSLPSIEDCVVEHNEAKNKRLTNQN